MLRCYIVTLLEIQSQRIIFSRRFRGSRRFPAHPSIPQIFLNTEAFPMQIFQNTEAFPMQIFHNIEAFPMPKGDRKNLREQGWAGNLRDLRNLREH